MTQFDFSSNTPFQRFRALFVAVALLGVWGCASGDLDGPVDGNQMSEHACSLIPGLTQTPVSEWANPGPKATELASATSAVALLGGMTGHPVADQGEAFNAAETLLTGLLALNEGRIQTGIEQLEEACAKVVPPATTPSLEANTSYACTLARNLDDSPLTFAEIMEQGSTSDLSAAHGEALNMAFSAAALLGGAVGMVFPAHPELSESANGLYAGLTRFDSHLAEESLQEILASCPA